MPFWHADFYSIFRPRASARQCRLEKDLDFWSRLPSSHSRGWIWPPQEALRLPSELLWLFTDSNVEEGLRKVILTIFSGSSICPSQWRKFRFGLCFSFCLLFKCPAVLRSYFSLCKCWCSGIKAQELLIIASIYSSWLSRSELAGHTPSILGLRSRVTILEIWQFLYPHENDTSLWRQSLMEQGAFTVQSFWFSLLEILLKAPEWLLSPLKNSKLSDM